MAMHRRPYTCSREESRYYEATPKRVLYAIARDLATRIVGEDHPELILAEMMQTAEIIKRAGLDQTPEA